MVISQSWDFSLRSKGLSAEDTTQEDVSFLRFAQSSHISLEVQNWGCQGFFSSNLVGFYGMVVSNSPLVMVCTPVATVFLEEYQPSFHPERSEG